MEAAAVIIQRSVDGLIPVENYITVPIRCLSASCTAMSPLTNQVLNTECDRTAFCALHHILCPADIPNF